jgi:hypothetical protein
MNLLQTKREDVNMVQDWLCEKVKFLISAHFITLREDRSVINVNTQDQVIVKWFTMELA